MMKQPVSILIALLASVVLTTACSKTDDPPYPRVAPPDRTTTIPLPKTMPESPVTPTTPVPKAGDGKTSAGKI
jgi:hypothetical protein